ncbi:nuclear receptor subfamily 2 group E member 1 [Caerostris darwini]|uniref:Nuclear receptor subfamily 2 group E member 1 n=1 Tax=Caerostris darwini TaxID=1538125 RepID=A0AAV4QPC4_9ARAC|nr:nuclear receptor subfamily 2 group E member 1 [Caerostris darwini]
MSSCASQSIVLTPLHQVSFLKNYGIKSSSHILNCDLQVLHTSRSELYHYYRILPDVRCVVCGDNSSGKHYGIFSCDGCAGFFKRSIRDCKNYSCMCKDKSGPITKINRNKCRKCRLTRCIAKGMNKNAVQQERGPRNSTKRRQQEAMALRTSPQPNYQSLYPSVPTDFVRRSSVYGSLLPIPAHPLTFNLPPYIYQPTPMYQPFRMHCYQLAADELMKNITLMRAVPDMKILPIEDQLVLLKEGWREMFLLGAAHQHILPSEAELHAQLRLSPSNSPRPLRIQDNLSKLRGVYMRILEKRLDCVELDYLKLLVLFKTGTIGKSSRVFNLSDPRTVTIIHDCYRGALLNHIGRTLFCIADDRWRSLEVLLSELNAVTDDMLVELLFSTYTTNSPFHEVLATLYAKPASC